MLDSATMRSIGSNWLVLSLAMSFQSAAVHAQESPADQQPRIVSGRILFGEGQALGEPQYWIGIECSLLPKEIIERLKLESAQGVAIEQVMPESPAAKAGLAKDDVIVAVDDKPLENVEQLTNAVAQGKGQSLKLAIVRGGQRHSIEVKPAPRPVERVIVIGEEDEGNELSARQRQEQLQRARSSLQAAVEESARSRRLEQYERALKAQTESGILNGPRPVQPYVPRPNVAGVIPGAALRVVPNPSLPDDMEVTVRKHGHEPAKVTVKQGQKTWKTTEQELDMLPPSARNYVGRLLGRPTAMRVRSRALPGEPMSGVGEPQAFEVQIDGARLELTNPPNLRPEANEAPGGYRVELRRAAEPKPAAEPVVRSLELNRRQPQSDEIERRVRELRLEIERVRKEIEERRTGAAPPPADPPGPTSP